MHNWNSRTTDGNPQVRTHTPSNEIASIDGNPFVSDFDGNLTDDGVSLYSYDEENRMTMVQDKVSGHINQQNQYDAFNRRVATTDTFGTQTLYFYDGWRTIEEQSSVGVTQATYVFGNMPDEVLNMDRGGASFYYHTNELGTIVALTDSTGMAVEAYQYDAYGYQTVILPGPNGVIDYGGDDDYLAGAKSSYGNPFLFTAQRYDSSSGLMYYKNRYYSTALGRFMSRDPIGIWGDPVELGNGYAYVGDNPQNSTDTGGLAAVDYFLKIDGLAPVAAAQSVTVCNPCHCPPAGASGPCDICCFTYTTLSQMSVGAFGTGPIRPGGTGPTYPGDPFPKGGYFSIADSGSGSGIIIGQDGWGMLAPSGGPGSENYIQAESEDDKHKNEFQLESWSFGTTQSGSFAVGGGGGAGKVQMQDFHFVKKVDKAGPKLLTACAKGEHIPKAVLVCRKAGKDQQEYMKITLSDCLVSAYHTSGSGGSDFTDYEYKEQKPDGTLGGTTKAEFNLKKMKATAFMVHGLGGWGMGTNWTGGQDWGGI